MARVRLTRVDVREDTQGETFADVVNDPEQPFGCVIQFLDDTTRQGRMKESELQPLGQVNSNHRLSRVPSLSRRQQNKHRPRRGQLKKQTMDDKRYEAIGLRRTANDVVVIASLEREYRSST